MTELIASLRGMTFQSPEGGSLRLQGLDPDQVKATSIEFQSPEGGSLRLQDWLLTKGVGDDYRFSPPKGAA